MQGCNNDALRAYRSDSRHLFLYYISPYFLVALVFTFKFPELVQKNMDLKS